MGTIEGWEVKIDETRKVFGGKYVPAPDEKMQDESLFFEFVNTDPALEGKCLRIRISSEALDAMNAIAAECGNPIKIFIRAMLMVDTGEWVELTKDSDATQA